MEQDEGPATFIRFGDSISFYVEDVLGYIRTEDSVLGKFVTEPNNKIDNPSIPNVKGATFEVLFPNKFKFAKKYAKMKKKAKKLGERINKLEELKETEKMAKLEEQDNNIEQIRKKGSEIQYGQIIQLRHILSGKYLQASHTEVAELEKLDFCVSLANENSKNCYFKIVPRFKIRAEGDPVRAGDQVTIESVKSPGRYLCCSNNVFANGLYKAFHEVSLSIRSASLVIVSHYASKDGEELLIKGGDVICLFHKELEGYLTAEGLFTEEKEIEKVHIRGRHTKVITESLVTKNSCSFWQIEKDRKTMDGSPIAWGENIRLKHLTTRKYLAIDKVDGVYLTSNFASRNTTFRLRPIIKNSVTIEDQSHALIEHPSTSSYLIGDEFKVYEYEQFKSNTKDPRSLSSLKWSRNVLRKVSVTKTIQFKDAFRMVRIDDRLIRDFNSVAGIVPTIHQFVTLLREKNKIVTVNKKMDKLKGHEYLPTIEALNNLCELISEEGKINKNLQNNLRYLRVVDLVVDILRIPFKSSRGVKRLGDIVHGSINLEDIDQYPDLKSVCIACYSLLTKYLEGKSGKNGLYLAKYFQFFQTQIGSGINAASALRNILKDNLAVVDRMEESHVEAFFDWLESQKNPDFLNFLSELCLCRNNAIPRNQNLVMSQLIENSKTFEILAEIQIKDGILKIRMPGEQSFSDPTESSLAYIKAQLHLLSSLCAGRNDQNIFLVKDKFCSLEQVIAGITSQIDYSLRTEFVKLLRNVFVDVGKNKPIIKSVKLSHDWESLNRNDAETDDPDPTNNACGEKLSFLPDIKKFIIQFLHVKSQMVYATETENENIFIATIFDLIHILVLYGYFKSFDEIRELVGAVTSVLNGKTDVPSPVYLNADSDSKNIKEWRKKERYQMVIGHGQAATAKTEGLKLMESLFNFSMSNQIAQFLDLFKDVNEMDHNSDNLLARKKREIIDIQSPDQVAPFFKKYFEEKFDLSPDVANKFFDYLQGQSKFLNPNGNLVDICMDLSRYESKELNMMALRVVNMYYSQISNLLKFAKQSRILADEVSKKTYHSITEMLLVLRRLSSIQLEDAEFAQVSAILDELIKLSSLEDDPLEPHPGNQRILINSNVISDIFELLKRPVDMGLKDRYGGLLKVRRQCFTFLRLFCRRSSYVKERLFQRLDQLMNIPGAEKEMALLVREIFVEEESLAMKLKDYQIEKIVLFAGEFQIPEFFMILTQVVRVDLPIKRNQNLAIKYMTQNRDKVLLLMNSSEREERLALLRKIGTTKESDLDPAFVIRATFHQHLIRLLATLAEGENKYCESVCQNILSIDDLFEVLQDTQINMNFKRPYLRYLLWTYFNIAGTPTATVQDICFEQRAWDLIMEIATRMTEISQKDFKEVPLKTPQDLIYAFEAAAPFFFVFYERFYIYSEKDTRLDGDIPNHKEMTLHVFKVMAEFYRKMRQHPNFGNKRDRKRVDTLLKLMIAKHYVPDEQVLVYDEIASIKIEIIKSEFGGSDRPSVQNYISKLKNEIEINKNKNIFTDKVIKIYEMSGLISEDSELPKGREFKQHMEVIVKNKKDKQKIKVQNIPSIIMCLQNSINSFQNMPENEKVIQSEIDMRHLYLFRGVLQNSFLRKENTQNEKDEKKHFELQANLNELGLTSTAIQCCSSSDDRIVRCAIGVIVDLLEGGHREVQNTFLEYFESSDEEQFFSNVITWIGESSASIKEVRTLRSSKRERLEKEKSLTMLASQTGSRGASIKNSVEDVPRKIIKEQKKDDTKLNEEDVEEEENLSFEYASKLLKPVFRLLQLLCENHNYKLRDYLRYQPDNLKSIDLVSEVAKFLLSIYTIVDYETIDLVIQTLDTLNEFSMGNVQNQNSLFDSQIVEPINQFMRQKNFGEKAERKDVAEIKEKTATIVKTMIEDNSKIARSVARQLLSLLDLEAFFETMLTYGDGKPENEEFKDVSFTCAGIFARLKDLLDSDKNLSDKQRKGFASIVELNLFDSDMSKVEKLSDKYEGKAFPQAFEIIQTMRVEFESIEVLVGEELQKVYFRKPENLLDDRMKDELLYTVNRESPSERIRDFVDKCQPLIERMYLIKKLKENPVAWIFVDYAFWINTITLLLTVIINIVMLSVWKANGDNGEVLPVVDPWFSIFIYVFGAFHIFFSFLLVAGYFLKNPPSLELPEEEEEEEEGLSSKDEENDKEQKKAEKAKRRATKPKKKFRTRVNEVITFLQSLIRVNDVYHLLFLALSIVGIFSQGYTYCFHLLHIVVGNDILVRVLMAVTKNGVSLLWTALLGVIIIYIYSIISFAFLRSSFAFEDSLWCDNMWQCFLVSISLGLPSDLGGVFPIYPFSWGAVGLRAIFDISYFVIISVIGLNIIFGIIVDTFSELRDEKYSIEDDMQNVCFICSLPSHDFDRIGDGFEHHVRKDHNMWNYLFFMIYLKEKDPTEFTSHESYVWSEMQRNEIDWFPINKALCLGQPETNADKVVNKIWSTLKKLQRRFNLKELKEKEEKLKELNQLQEEQDEEVRKRSQSIMGKTKEASKVAKSILRTSVAGSIRVAKRLPAFGKEDGEQGEPRDRGMSFLPSDLS